MRGVFNGFAMARYGGDAGVVDSDGDGVEDPPVTVTLTLSIGFKTGTDMVVEVEKDPGERLQFEIEDVMEDEDE